VESLRTTIGAILLLITISSYPQNLIDESRIRFNLSDGISVVLYKADDPDKGNVYHYLPVNMHISYRDRIPEISLVHFDEDGSNGAILHFLLTWGLSQSQEREVTELLEKQHGDSVIVAGPVMVDAAPESFLITGNDKTVTLLNRAMAQNSQVPLFPGSKLAASFRFRGEDADYVLSMAEHDGGKTEGEIQMVFTYKTMVRDGIIHKATDNRWSLTMPLETLFKLLRD